MVNNKKSEECHTYKIANFLDETFEEMLNTMEVMVIIVSPTKFLYANKAFFKGTGYTEKDLMTLKIENLLTDNNRTFLLERVKRRLQRDDTLPSMYPNIELTRKNGEIFICNLYPSYICFEGERCLIYTAIETTAQRKVEKALNGFFEYCPLPAFIKDKNRRIIKATSYYEKSLGKTDLEVIGKTSDEVFEKDFAKKIKEEDDLVFKTKTPITVDEELGGKHYVKIKFPINGDLIGGFSIDITERVEHRKELEIQKKKYEELYDVLSSMLDTMTDMLWVYDKNKNIKFSNKALREFTLENDISVDECIDCTLLSDKKEKQIKTFEKDGNRIDLEIIKTPLFDEEGNIVGCNGVLTDVTETLQIQNNIIEKLEKLEDNTLKDTKKAITNLSNTLSLFNRRWETNGR